MNYHTVREVQSFAEQAGLKVIEVYKENKWIAILLSSGVVIKIRAW